MDELPAGLTPDPVDIVIEDERWLDTGLEALAQSAVAAACEYLELAPQPAVVIMGCDDVRIATLNTQFRGKPTPTNVLSWPAVEHIPHAPGEWPQIPQVDELGDIAIAWDTCAREAGEQGKTMADHVAHLLVHAVLHLAGFDHENDPDAELMEEAERQILRRLEISDPYQEQAG
ncbi:MAG: rRNA maturation RNase YbeY [Paracoccus sp. (in: a-proteobacteria)]|uniref:rRNA maturation RNase YbeY n=1 Tax=Paracoccus sp. TaxID=267 RepID=UPI0026DFED41|nr:rRNA maturation RNase YbeY [Paracoccus sp. (in: a-proteobacteria)]MDO5622665.1 rRNA maturation RNase YbeY [Paracoccus sp. (in: a-proteobacteria)]